MTLTQTTGTELRRSLWLLLSLACLLAGAAMAWHHPWSPMWAMAAFWGWVLVAAWRPGVWLWVAPACLPFMNFSPWTGWLVFEEFDLLLLGALAGGYGRWVARSPQVVSPLPRGLVGLLGLMAAFSLVSLVRGFMDAGGFVFDWFASYSDALNGWRVFKSMAFAWLLVPLLHHELQVAQAHACQRLRGGMLVGLAVVVTAVLWERAAFFGLTDFSTNYRTIALFWEMHVGGAAIDGYLALAMPFVVWALMAARRPGAWGAAAVLALAATYACLTTFSRGLYGAVAGSLLLLVGLWWRQSGVSVQAVWAGVRQRERWSWRARGGVVLALALVLEIAWVFGAGTFMADRLSSTERDLGGRLAHWQSGLELRRSPADHWLGIGLGRLPSRYSAYVPEREFSGAVTWQPGFVTLLGPSTQSYFGGRYALTQRVDELLAGPYRVTLQVRAPASVGLRVSLCEQHLLYERRCQRAFVKLEATPNGWQTVAFPLHGTTLSNGAWYAPRLALLSLAVVDAAGRVDVANVRLQHATQPVNLQNTDFSSGLTHWLPVAQSHFVPWHIDNVYLELLIERGGLGLGLMLLFAGMAVFSVLKGPARRHAAARFLAASLLGVATVGLVSSVLDVPRLTFMFCLMALFAVLLRRDNA